MASSTSTSSSSSSTSTVSMAADAATLLADPSGLGGDAYTTALRREPSFLDDDDDFTPGSTPSATSAGGGSGSDSDSDSDSDSGSGSDDGGSGSGSGGAAAGSGGRRRRHHRRRGEATDDDGGGVITGQFAGKTYYQILNLDRRCTEAQVARAAKQMRLIFHPDKHPDKGTRGANSHEDFVAVQRAAKVLGDARLRSIYDEGGEESVREYERKLKSSTRALTPAYKDKVLEAVRLEAHKKAKRWARGHGGGGTVYLGKDGVGGRLVLYYDASTIGTRVRKVLNARSAHKARQEARQARAAAAAAAAEHEKAIASSSHSRARHHPGGGFVSADVARLAGVDSGSTRAAVESASKSLPSIVAAPPAASASRLRDDGYEGSLLKLCSELFQGFNMVLAATEIKYQIHDAREYAQLQAQAQQTRDVRRDSSGRMDGGDRSAAAPIKWNDPRKVLELARMTDVVCSVVSRASNRRALGLPAVNIHALCRYDPRWPIGIDAEVPLPAFGQGAAGTPSLRATVRHAFRHPLELQGYGVAALSDNPSVTVGVARQLHIQGLLAYLGLQQKQTESSRARRRRLKREARARARGRQVGGKPVLGTFDVQASVNDGLGVSMGLAQGQSRLRLAASEADPLSASMTLSHRIQRWAQFTGGLGWSLSSLVTAATGSAPKAGGRAWWIPTLTVTGLFKASRHTVMTTRVQMDDRSVGAVLGVTRESMNVSFPVRVGAGLDWIAVGVTLLGSLIPPLAIYTVRHVRARRAAARSERRKALKQRLAEDRANAERQLVPLRAAAAMRRRLERRRGGLVILRARYGIAHPVFPDEEEASRASRSTVEGLDEAEDTEADNDDGDSGSESDADAAAGGTGDAGATSRAGAASGVAGADSGDGTGTRPGPSRAGQQGGESTEEGTGGGSASDNATDGGEPRTGTAGSAGGAGAAASGSNASPGASAGAQSEPGQPDLWEEVEEMPVIDVADVLQSLVDNGSLTLQRGTKRHLVGFYHPCPTAEGELKLSVRYSFGGVEVDAEFDDTEPLTLPLRVPESDPRVSFVSK